MKITALLVAVSLVLTACKSPSSDEPSMPPSAAMAAEQDAHARQVAEQQAALAAQAEAAREVARAEQAQRELAAAQAARAAEEQAAAEAAARAAAEQEAKEKLAAEQAAKEKEAADRAAAEKLAAEQAAAEKAAADKAAADKAAAEKAAAAAAPGAAPQETPMSDDLNVVAVMETTAGTLEVGFFPDVAPGHVKNFVDLARKGFYDGTRFHRTIPGFMIQGGDPNTKDLAKQATWGMGDPGYKIKAEFNSRPHERGTLSMARSGHPDSAGSQFFICHARAASLDRQYTVFGELLKGYDVLDKIATAPATMSPGGERSKPVNPVQIVKVTIRARTPADVKEGG